MNKLTPTEELKMLILEAEEKRIRLEAELKNDIQDFFEQLKPGNLIRKGVQSFAESGSVKQNVIKAGAGIGAALLFKKLFFKRLRKGIISGLIGFALEQGLVYAAKNGVVAKVADKIKGKAKRFIGNTNGHRQRQEHEGELWDVQG